MDVRKNGHLQRELLRAAVDCCKPGGIIVYSTCSISVEENEAVVDYITRVRHVKIRDTGLPIKKEGLVNYKEHRFNPKVALTRRVYPHVHNMDGFFIAKIQKIKDGEKKVAETTEVSKPVIAGKKKNKKDKKKVKKPHTGDDGLTKKQRNKLAKNLKKRRPQTEAELAATEEVKENTEETIPAPVPAP
jgi:ribosomal RNA methyltransferase Nop2